MRRFNLTQLATQFKISNLMILVALSAIGMYAYPIVSEKSARLARTRIRYEVKSDVNRKARLLYTKALAKQSYPAVRSWLSDQARYHGDLEKKYKKAASFPWMTVAPDPPRPLTIITEEQVAESLKSMTPAEIKAKYEGPKHRPYKYGLQPSHLPRKLSDLKSL
ncbi:hypothetical protein V5E97_25610 [Singulisphaera sp. Ch08]|uniref:Uncharacterized protein n=1 Tax=Singulisphaera sp. Ch08 TaxID=3120278 RepID=A0AAU7CAG9_9BACT